MVSVTPVGSTIHWASGIGPSKMQWGPHGRCHGSECKTVTGFEEAFNKFFEFKEAANGTYAYCDNPDYNFVYDAEFVYGPYHCAWHAQWGTLLTTVGEEGGGYK